MRSSEPIPGNPWPHDMVLSVEPIWEPLIFLLFVRTAWKLEIDAVPALEVEPDIGASGRPMGLNVEDAIARWLFEWKRAWTHFAAHHQPIAPPDADTQHLLDTLSDDELWDATSTWPSKFWDEGIDREACGRWRRILQPPFEDSPEHKVVSALIPAWESGLTTIIQLPYLGYFAERINREHLVVSAATRRDPKLFSRALSS